jgi:CcmD family protein
MEKFLEQNSYYVVLIITLLIWIGIFYYMTSIDRKLKKLEKKEV